jgi:hypothetical protein
MNGVYTNLAKKRVEQSKEPGKVGAVPPLSKTPVLREVQVAAQKQTREPVVIPALGQKGKKAGNQQPSKSINAAQQKLEKFDKYSTYLRPGYKKELKVLAAS